MKMEKMDYFSMWYLTTNEFFLDYWFVDFYSLHALSLNLFWVVLYNYVHVLYMSYKWAATSLDLYCYYNVIIKTVIMWGFEE